jgi:hypothetical protein
VDRLVVADQPQGCLVRVVEPGFPYLAVQDRDPVPGLGAVSGAFLPAEKRPVRPLQPPLCLPQEPRVRNRLVVRRDNQRVQAQVDPYFPIAEGQRHGLAFHHERSVIPAVRLADYRDRGRDGRQVPGPLNLDVPDLGHVQPLAVQREPVAGEPDGLPATLAAGFRVPDLRPLPPALKRVEPVPIRAPRVLARLDEGDCRDFSEPGPFRRGLGQGDHTALNLGVADLLSARVRLVADPQAVVVHHPGAAENPR